MAREEEEKSGIGSAGRIVNPGFLKNAPRYSIQAEPGVDLPYQFGSIAAGTFPGSCTITGTRILYEDQAGGGFQPVTAAGVPAGAEIQVFATVQCNSGDGSKIWSIALLCIDTISGGLKNYWEHLTTADYLGLGSADITGEFQLKALGKMVMPPANVNLKINLFASANGTNPPDLTAAMFTM